MITQEGIRQDERRQLNQLAGISPEDQVAILNLFYLNVTLLQGTSAKKRAQVGKRACGEQGYDVSRYVPPLKRTVEDLLSSGLSSAEFPFVAPPEALLVATRDAQVSARAKGKANTGGSGGEATPASGRRLIVVVLGGLCYSELRSLHEAARAHGRDIIVGSTAMLTPREYLIALKEMKQLEPHLV